MTNYAELFSKMPIADMTWDIEATGLLDETSIDYNASPYTLRNTYKQHCVVFENHKTGEIIAFHDGDKYEFDGREYVEEIDGETYTLEPGYAPIEYTHYPMAALKSFIENAPKRRVVAHNQISYDLMSVKLSLKIPFTIGYEVKDRGLTTYTNDTWGDNKVFFLDTLVLSKCLNPDRYGGHSLEKLAAGSGTEKVQFRKHMHVDVRFKTFAADMLYYCIFDVKSNTQVYYGLMDGTKNKVKVKSGYQLGPNLNDPAEAAQWRSAIKLEHNIADIITRQEHRGFWFDRELAHRNLDELDKLMEDARVKVEPLLPPKPATATFMKNYIPPKNQFNKDGNPSANLLKFIAKHEGELIGDRKVRMLGKEYDLPFPEGVSLITEQVASINDTTHIKNWLIGLGWTPTEWKEKDITVDTKKNKKPWDKLVVSIDRYLDETFDPQCNFREGRIEHFSEMHMGIYSNTRKPAVREALLERAEKRGLKVKTNPSFTVGVDKEMCPDLERMIEHFPFAKDLIGYLTYKHRRNSILGGGIDWDDPDEEPEKGYLSYIREDGRVPTPADTCGAATSRFKHRKIANIPRVTSLYGKQLRALFGASEGYFQIGYDFDSLEARIEAAYCWQYDNVDHAYCLSLTMDKPNDVHTKMAQAISAIIGRTFGRSPAKNVKYGCTYGAQAAKVAKTIGDTLAVGQQVFDAFWIAAFPLAELKDALTRQWEANGKAYIIGIDGRRVPTRSAHAILNSLFQSGGVICAKRAMVIHDVALKAAGLSVDFFVDDWKNKEWCQQMMAYHDEAQLEASKQSFKFKTFDTKEEAQAFKDEDLAATGKVWSDISTRDEDKGGGFYVAYSRAGELAVEAVAAAGEFYRAPDDLVADVAPHSLGLSAGYIVNSNWAGCH